MSGKEFFSVGRTVVIMAASSALLFALILLFHEISPQQLLDVFGGMWGKPKTALALVSVAYILILSALSFSVPLQGGFYNLGAEGQILFGAAVASIVFVKLNAGSAGLLPLVVWVVTASLVAGAGGAALAGLALIIRRAAGVSEVITTLLLNGLALMLTSWLMIKADITDWEGVAEGVQSVKFTPSLGAATTGGSPASVVVIVALVAALLVEWWVWNTICGLSLRAIGQNRIAARLAGVRVERQIGVAVLVGGFAAGLGGINQLLVAGHFNPSHFVNYGFDGIVVALLGRHKFAGILIAGGFVAIWRHLSSVLQVYDVSGEAVLMAEAAAILLFLVWDRPRKV